MKTAIYVLLAIIVAGLGFWLWMHTRPAPSIPMDQRGAVAVNQAPGDKPAEMPPPAPVLNPALLSIAPPAASLVGMLGGGA